MGYDLFSVRINPETGDAEYYRFNMWAMGRVCQVLSALGVLDEEVDFPKWPERPGDEHFDEDGTPLTEEAEDYLREIEDIRAMHPRNGKVPYYKFYTNDGWIVTPEECEALSKAILGAGKEKIKSILERYVDTDGAESLDEFAESIVEFGRYCERCASLGGFSVC